jgi:hypothetical protein
MVTGRRGATRDAMAVSEGQEVKAGDSLKVDQKIIEFA